VSEPRTINAYLAALNDALEVGLRSRRRILTEVGDHLWEATQEHLQRGISPRDAQWRAIVAFGSSEQVAARFDAGLVGALDRRLALSVRWVHRWVTQHRLGIPAFIVVVSMLFGGAFAALGAAFGRDALVAAGAFLSGALAALTFFMLSRSFRQTLRDITTNSMVSPLLALLFAYPAISSCLVLLDGDSLTVWWYFGSFSLAYALLGVSHSLIEGAINRAARRYVAATEHDRRQMWSADHPWLSAVAGVAPLPLALVTLISVHPGPVALRVALVVLVAALTALVVVAVRLEAGRRERDAYQRVLMSEAT